MVVSELRRSRWRVAPLRAVSELHVQGGAAVSADGAVVSDEAYERVFMTDSKGDVHELSIPLGWHVQTFSLRPVGDGTDLWVLLTPDRMLAVTINLRERALRSGYAATGPVLGEMWSAKFGRTRPRYTRQGWRQRLVDAAAAHLRAVLKPADVVEALREGGEVRRAAERTLKRSPRR